MLFLISGCAVNGKSNYGYYPEYFTYSEDKGIRWFQGIWVARYNKQEPIYSVSYTDSFTGEKAFSAHIISVNGSNIQIEHILENCSGTWELVGRKELKSTFQYFFKEKIINGQCKGYGNISVEAYKKSYGGKPENLTISAWASRDIKNKKNLQIISIGEKSPSYGEATNSVRSWIVEHSITADGSRKSDDPVWCEKLVKAAYDRDLKQVEILSSIVDVNCSMPNNASALWSALLNSRGSNRGKSTFDIVKLLVDEGADVNYIREGRSVSHWAGLRGRSKSAAYIVANGGSRKDVEDGLRERNFDSELFTRGFKAFAKGATDTAVQVSKFLGSTNVDDFVIIEAEGNCGVLNRCLLNNLNIYGGKGDFEKILDDGINGSMSRRNGPVAGNYSWSLKVDDRQCSGQFNLEESARNVILSINPDCSVQSIIQ